MDRFAEMTDRIVDRVLACDNAAVTQMLRDLWDTAHEQGRTQKKEQNRAQRLQAVNELLGEIANRGRRFFWHRGNVSRFVWDQDKLWYMDGGNGRKLALHGRPTWNGFTEGFTLATLVAGLRDFIRTGQPLPSATFGPWPEYIAGGGLMGLRGRDGPDPSKSLRSRCHCRPGGTGTGLAFFCLPLLQSEYLERNGICLPLYTRFQTGKRARCRRPIMSMTPRST